MGFLGVYKAIYDYAPQSEGELSITEGDILYVLDKSDEDDWWKAKKKAGADEEDEPVGLIPNNYIEEVRTKDYKRPSRRLLSLFRRNLWAKLAPCTNTHARRTKSCPSPKMPSYKFLTRRTPIGSLWVSKTIMDLSRRIILRWEDQKPKPKPKPKPNWTSMSSPPLYRYPYLRPRHYRRDLLLRPNQKNLGAHLFRIGDRR